MHRLHILVDKVLWLRKLNRRRSHRVSETNGWVLYHITYAIHLYRGYHVIKASILFYTADKSMYSYWQHEQYRPSRQDTKHLILRKCAQCGYKNTFQYTYLDMLYRIGTCGKLAWASLSTASAIFLHWRLTWTIDKVAGGCRR